MRNLNAGFVVVFSTQQTAWTVLDIQGLRRYGDTGRPYELNPVFGAIVAVVALCVGIKVLGKRAPLSMPVAIGLAIYAGFHFRLSREPASPYKNYGDDNFGRMISNLLLIGFILLLVCGGESLLGKSRCESAEEKDSKNPR